MKTILSATAITLALSAPSFAQDAICGGISVVGDWAGGSEAASDLTTAATAFDADGQVPIAGHLVRMFTLSGPTDIRVEVAAVPAGDPYISIYDASGAEVAADDDSGGDFASRVETSLGAGTYCLAARSYESGVTDVAVRIGRMDHDPALTGAGVPNIATTGTGIGVEGATCGSPDVIQIASDLTPDELAAGVSHVATAGHAPGLAFTLMDEMPISITATSDSGDPLIRLLDGSGQQIGENDDFDGLNSRIDMTTPLAPGAYCVAVEDLNGPTNNITVGLELFDPAAERLRALNAAEFAPTPQDDVPITEVGVVEGTFLVDINSTGDASWVRFDLPEGGLLVAEAIGAGVDPALVLFDRVGRRLGENDDGPTGLDSFLAMRVLPGSYLLAVRNIDDTSGSVRVLLERYVLAQ